MPPNRSDSDAPSAPGRKKRKAHQWVLMLLGPALLLVIVSLLDLDVLGEAIRSVDLALFLGASTSLALTVLLRTWRWRMLLRDIEPNMPPFFDMVMIYAYATYIGVATPGRVGEFVKAFHLRNLGIPTGVAMANVLTDRMLDIVTLLIIATVSLLVVALPGEQSDLLVAALVAIVLGATAIGWWVLRSRFIDRVGAVAAQIELRPVKKLVDRFSALALDFRDAVRQQKKRTLALSMIPTLASFAVVYGANLLIARSVGLDELGYLDIIAVSAVTSVAAQLPITVLGVGTREAAMIAVLAPYGVSEERAVVLSLFFLASVVYLALLCAMSMLSPAVRFARDEVRGNDSD